MLKCKLFLIQAKKYLMLLNIKNNIICGPDNRKKVIMRVLYRYSECIKLEEYKKNIEINIGFV